MVAGQIQSLRADIAHVDIANVTHSIAIPCQPEHLRPQRGMVQRPVTQDMTHGAAQCVVCGSVGVAVDQLVCLSLFKPEQAHFKIGIGKGHAFVFL